MIVQLGEQRWIEAAGAVTAAREPHGVIGGVVGDLEEGGAPLRVRPGEMPGDRKALRMKMQLHPPAKPRRRNARGFLRQFWRDLPAGANKGDMFDGLGHQILGRRKMR